MHIYNIMRTFEDSELRKKNSVGFNVFQCVIYSRTSVARTLMARFPRLFRTSFRVPIKINPIEADLIICGIILVQ